MSSSARRPDTPVSVVITAYNSGSFLEAAVASVYAQTLAPSEVIVIDDGSTDDTEERLQRVASTLPPSFIWKRKQNGGVASALNAGVGLAEGDYIAFLDHDDIWHPQKLERQLQHFASDRELVLSFTGYTYLFRGYRHLPGRTSSPFSGPHDEPWDPASDAALEQLLIGHRFIGPISTVMIKRHALARLPPFDETLITASDKAMYLEVVVRRMRMDYLREPLVEYRWHGNNLSRDTGLAFEDLCTLYDKFWKEHGHRLPEHLRTLGPSWRSHWHLQTAIDAIRHGDRTRARRHILKAARTRPLAIRPGWVRMLGIASPPTGPWPE